MKILIFTISSWNSKIGSNTWATLVEQFNPDNIANIFLREEVPDNKACNNYFNISENRVLKSVFKRKIKTGKRIDLLNGVEQQKSIDVEEHNERYRKMRQKRRYSMLLARELVWKFGKWKTKELNDFLDEFKPDIILYSFEGYIHLNRIVNYAIKRTKAKAIGYIWDDTFTYKQSTKFGYKIYRFFQRKSLKKLAKRTQGFFAITPKTKQEADAFFNINCTVLSKPLNAQPVAYTYSMVQKPLRMLYTGNLLIGRDKSLCQVSQALAEINKNEKEIVLDVYTQTELTDEYLQNVQHETCKIHSAIAQSEVLNKQREADVLLFLEDLSNKNLTARLSFSTKITDYFSTGKCIFAIGNPDLAPMQYFAETQSALIVDKKEDISSGLMRLLDKGNLAVYSSNAVKCAINNHSAEYINKTFYEEVNRVHKG